MVIEKQLEKMPIKEEIDYLIQVINNICFRWEKRKSKLAIINKNTIEDLTFIEIYNHNKDKFRNELIIIKNLTELTDEMILINTDTYLLSQTKIHPIRINYTINIFIDYTQEYLYKICLIYGAKFSQCVPTDYGMRDEVLEALKQYLTGTLDITKLDLEVRKEFIAFLKERNTPVIKDIPNSYSKRQWNDIYF